MRKDPKWWGYLRYDMRFDPSFYIKTKVTEMLSPGQPIGELHMERIERECVTDHVLRGVPTLEDLGVQLTSMESQVPWELRPFRAALYFDADIGDFEAPVPPVTISAREEKRLYSN